MDSIEVTIPGRLWDRIVDSLDQDFPKVCPDQAFPLDRRAAAWSHRRAGFGSRVSAVLPSDFARYVVQYLRSIAGASEQTWAYDPEERAGMRAEGAAASRTADAIERRLA